ncbi:hypothetical protein Pcinc_020068 [Petrolisthes cinctipes]|uniref:Uncharacterized protein n=1 Tax=Petrolisthes cinctipes TaxID=88211 RepID=A0AAE1KJI2_PETCI|nr:hypothetical protein Pcinc_020068 [Petrolisthes cinctipes]
MNLRRNRFGLMVLGIVATITLLTHEQFTIILFPKSTIRLHPLLETIYFDNTTHKLSHNCQQVVHLELCGCNRTQQLATCPPQVTKYTDQSTCGSTATLRGPGQKVVSYVVYGRFPNAYYNGLEKLVYEVPKFYPGWSMRVHLNWAQDNLRDWACALACNNSHLDICNVQNLPGIGNVNESFAMTWRFSVMGDPLVNRYIVRDSDTPLIQREVDAVNEWIRLGTCFHTMRDHIAHRSPVMGGMWGGCNYWQPSKNKEIRTILFLSRKKYGGDQNALTTYLLPWAKENMTSHASYPCKQFPGSLPFPTRRVSGTFVGSRNYRMRNDTIFRQCPWECRPKLHKDWEMC